MRPLYRGGNSDLPSLNQPSPNTARSTRRRRAGLRVMMGVRAVALRVPRSGTTSVVILTARKLGLAKLKDRCIKRAYADDMDLWTAVGALLSLAAVVVAAISAGQSKLAAREANATATQLARIERQRRHAELTPKFKITCDNTTPGVDLPKLRIALTGPVGLDHLDKLTVSIRNDQLHRGEAAIATGPTSEEIERHIWGPYRFTPRTGPDNELSDETGRTTAYGRELPTGESLVYQLEPTHHPPWATGMTSNQWRTQMGRTVRLTLTASNDNHEPWTIPCEVTVPDGLT